MKKTAKEKGEADARRDVAAGKLIIRLRGMAAFPPPDFKEKYGIEFSIGGCLVSEDIDEYDDGYNKISEAEIRRRFGRQFFKVYDLD